MNNKDLAKAAKIIAITYRKALDVDELRVWLSIFKYVPIEKFTKALHSHITDTDQGRWMPTPAHILNHLVKSDTSIKIQAGMQFDIQPTCDGTDSWTAKNESSFDRSARRREWIAKNIEQWKRDMSFERKLLESDVISEVQYFALTKETELGLLE